MNYLVSSTALVLFALFYHLSGGAAFDPAHPEETAVQTPSETRFDFAEYYVPFDQPIIIPAPAPVQVAEATRIQDPNIVQASFGNEPAPAPREDIRAIAGDWVNVRRGPSTDDAVIATVPRGTEVALLSQTSDDWARIRLLETNQTVWVAAWLLSD